MRFVIDASVAVEYLLRTRTGQQVAPMLSGAALLAPELLYAEVMAVLRREVLTGRVDEHRAAEAVRDLEAWPLICIPPPPLLQRAWQLRHNISAYDALYVAAAQAHGATLLTADGPLARVPVPLGVVVQNVRA